MTMDASAWVTSGRQVPVRDGRRLFLRRAGAGPAVLLIHGYPSWSWDWSRVASLLEPAATVLAPDLLGFGYSDKPRQRYSIAGQADAIEDLIAHERIETLHLVAHDYGTIVAQELLDRWSAGTLSFGISRVTLLNAAIIAGLHRPSRAHQLLSRPVIGALIAARTKPAHWRAGLQRLAGADYTIGDEEFSQFWAGSAQGNDPVQLHRMLHYVSERRRQSARWEEALASFDGPLRFVWGMHDPLSGAHVLAEARQRYPRADVTELQGVGHWPQLEAPAAVAAGISELTV